MPDPAAVAPLEDACALVGLTARLLYANGQTTRRVIEDVERLAHAIGYVASVIPNWGQLVIRLARADAPMAEHTLVLTGPPVGVEMNKVTRTLRMIDDLCAGRLDAVSARTALEAVARLPPVSTLRFATLAAAGAAALGIIFGSTSVQSLLLIAASAGAGALLRRLIAARGGSVLLQPLAAALLAGLVGAAAAGLVPAADAYLVALCPCMVLMPGPHLLNAALDFAHLRMTLAQARLAYALLLTLMICVGLIAGLSIGQQSLPPPGAGSRVPLTFDVLAAGVAVAAYGTFFSLPWRSLTIPVAIGMLAHACRWVALSGGASAPVGAFVACLIVGTLVTPVANRLRLPFAAFAFASVVSLIPGAYLFRMAAALVAVMQAGPAGDVQLLMAPFVDGTTAAAILFAMALGLILPKLLMENLFPTVAGIAMLEKR